MASGLQSYTATFSGDFASHIGGKIIEAAKNAKQEKENQKKAEELGIDVPAEEKKGLFKKALIYEFGGRRFDRTVGPFLKNKTSKQVSSKSTFADKFSYTKDLKKSKGKPIGSASPVGRTTTKKGEGRGGRFSFVRGFGELSLQLEQLNNKVSSLVAVANKQLGATYRTSGGIAGVQKILAEQNNLQKESIEDAKTAREEASMDATKNVSGSDVYKSSFDQTPGWNDETGQPEPIAPAGDRTGVPEGGGGILDTLGNAADIADTALDLGKTAKNIGKRGAGRGLTRAGAAVGGKKGAKIGSKISGFGSKLFGKSIAKPAGKGVAKAAAKGVAKGVGKSLVKKIPIIGAIAGIGFGIQRAMEGDWLGAAGEVGSGLAATVPGAGTAVSTGIDAALIGRDVAKESAQPQAEGGVVPLSSKVAQKMIPSLVPGLGAVSAAANMMTSNNDSSKEVSQMPFKAIGGAILSVTNGFVKALGPIGGVVAPMIRQEISPLARMLGMPSSIVKFGGIGGASIAQSPNAMKQGMDFMKKFMEGALEKLGIKPKKEEKESSGGGGGGGGGSTSEDSSIEDTQPSASPGAAPAAPAPGMRNMTGDEYAAKVTKEVKGEVIRRENLRGGKTKNIYGITDARLAPVKNAETGKPTPYYHDTFGQLYKMNPNDGKVTRLTQDEITAAQSIAQTGGDFATGSWHFFRKPDKNVVIGRLQSMPVGSIKIATKEIVYEEQKSERSGKVKRLRQPSQDERAKYGIDQIKAPFGVPSAPVPQVQAASGITVTSNGGGNKQMQPGKTYGFADLNPHHSGEGRNRQYGGISVGVPKDYGMGVTPNYMPAGPSGKIPLPVAGKVLLKEWDKTSGYGRTVIVDTSLGKMQFSHLAKFGAFQQGDKLAAGTIVGVQGGSGNRGESDYAPHLHLNASKKGHEAFVNFITSGKPTTGSVSDGETDSDSPSAEDNAQNQESQDPMEAFKQSVLGAITGVQQLAGLAGGKKFEEVKDINQGKSFADIFNPSQSPDPAAGTTTTPPKINPPSGTAANVTPNQTSPAAAARPATSQASPNSAQLASAVTGRPSQIVPMPMASTTPGGGGSFHVKPTDFGTAENLRPQLASYIG